VERHEKRVEIVGENNDVNITQRRRKSLKPLKVVEHNMNNHTVI
jgi:hypothetical protein